MKEGDVVLAPVPQASGYGDLLICGVSTQLRQEVVGFDDLIGPGDPDFRPSGLEAPSLIRLGFLAVMPPSGLLGAIGSISEDRHGRLQRLSNHLRLKSEKPGR